MQMIAIVLASCMHTTSESPAVVQLDHWIPRLTGTMSDGGGNIDFESNIDLHDQESTPTVSFSLIPINDITTSISVFDFSTSSSGTFEGNRTFGSMSIQNGDAYDASIRLSSIGWEAAWDAGKPYETSDRASLTFAPIAGLQWYGVDGMLENVTDAQSVTHNNSWVSVQGGLRVHFDLNTRNSTNLLDSVSFESQCMAGILFGGDGGVMWSVQAMVALHLSPSVSGHFGYRLQELYAEDGAYAFDAGVQGLYLGGAVRF